MAKASLAKMAKQLAKTESCKDAFTNRIKVTLTISGDVLALLEKNQAKIRSMIDPRFRNQVNKSLLMELAVKAAIEEFEDKETASQLYVDTETQLASNLK